MDVLEELKKTRLMVLARGVQKDVLLKAALSVLALMPAENVQAFDSLTTRWTFGAQVKLNHALLSAALDQQGPWAGRGIASNDGWMKHQLREVIGRIDWSEARRDVLPFVYASDRLSLDLWSETFFVSLLDRLF